MKTREEIIERSVVLAKGKDYQEAARYAYDSAIANGYEQEDAEGMAHEAEYRHGVEEVSDEFWGKEQ